MRCKLWTLLGAVELQMTQKHRHVYETRSSATAETARVTIRPATVIDLPTLTITLNVAYVNIISLTELSNSVA